MEQLGILTGVVMLRRIAQRVDSSVVRIDLRVGDTIVLEICNQCMPLSKEEFAQLCDRFYRVRGTDNTEFCVRIAFPSPVPISPGYSATA